MHGDPNHQKAVSERVRGLGHGLQNKDYCAEIAVYVTELFL